jgi:hypothetical protein
MQVHTLDFLPTETTNAPHPHTHQPGGEPPIDIDSENKGINAIPRSP